MLHIVIIHSYRVGVINADNKMITLARRQDNMDISNNQKNEKHYRE